MSQIPRTYNIPESILTRAEALGLDAMATGGGLDYIYKVVGRNSDGSDRVALVVSGVDAGSPDTLNETAEVSVMLKEDWTDQVNFGFPSARRALEALAAGYDPYAGSAVHPSGTPPRTPSRRQDWRPEG